uniref:Uncharacterized protein n=1 Tax=Ditylenchus dipsaci TaxID=166011 RepID=A0A915CSZ7_9BILA
MNNKMNGAIGSTKNFASSASNASIKKNGIGNSAQVNGKRTFDANFRHPGDAAPPPFKQPFIPFNSLTASRASTSAASTSMTMNRLDASRTSQKPQVKPQMKRATNGVSCRKLKGVKSEEKWLLTNQQFYQIPSFADGVKPKEETKMRRQAAKFIQCMGSISIAGSLNQDGKSLRTAWA